MGEEISWSITDTTSDVSVDGSAYDSDHGNNEVVESVTLCHNKCYDFVIQDSAGDGLCDPDNNCGEYGIFVNGEEVYSDEEGDFGSSNTVSFVLTAVVMLWNLSVVTILIFYGKIELIRIAIGLREKS